jgi:hypothetical protein
MPPEIAHPVLRIDRLLKFHRLPWGGQTRCEARRWGKATIHVGRREAGWRSGWAAQDRHRYPPRAAAVEPGWDASHGNQPKGWAYVRESRQSA